MFVQPRQVVKGEEHGRLVQTRIWMQDLHRSSRVLFFVYVSFFGMCSLYSGSMIFTFFCFGRVVVCVFLFRSVFFIFYSNFSLVYKDNTAGAAASPPLPRCHVSLKD